MAPLLKKLLGINLVLVILMYGLLIFGVYAVESAARHLIGGGEAFADRQKVWIMLGSVVFLITSLIDYKWYKWLAAPAYIIGLILMVASVLFGNEIHQLKIGTLYFQPAQFAIASGILMMAVCLHYLPNYNAIFRLPIVKVAMIGLIAGIPFLIVVATGDMGTAIVWLPVMAVVMLAAGIPYRYLILMAVLGFGMIAPLHYVILPIASERGAGRIELYLDMLHDRDVDISDGAYAPYWVSTAIGKAGWKGTGWNAGEDKGSLHDKKYVPWKTAHNDFIFAVIGEEHGFRGSILLVISYGVLFVASLFVALSSRDPAGRIICSAIVALLFAHMFENIGMCILLLPITGIPLPFVSYSGTFTLICMFLMGLIQSVWIHRKTPVEEVVDDKQPNLYVR
ncbi:FtsW/RodA/SpoVE family cell cycle protein [Persicirhabdus sediminis]|uniref:FtsW/RodA/SpoVE family cell cycle protein n=1 Tax=Persicirhabdus sediminis TaxID=454144 RepID=A0A8J7SM92_9BACT|nr:FtsW/RodA/SpoVE family cell cycle protein [Persicirhabdus sediminis]MBK1791920.1 FtsW/RodA/SpoVE family cell cycle protein [Persicirhabdus sediminis]